MSDRRSPAARFVGQSVHRKEDRRLLTGHGLYVDDVVAARHAPRRVPSQRDGQGDDHATSTPRRPADSLAWSRCFTWQDFDGTLSARRGTPCSASSCRFRRRWPSATCATSVSRSPWSSPRAATSPRTRCELIELDLEPDRAGRRLRHRRPRHRPSRARRLGLPIQRDGRAAVHAAVAGSRRGVRRRRARGRVHGAPEPLRLRADGDSRHRRRLGAGPGRARHRLLVPERARDPQLLRPLPPGPRGRDPGDGTRRRRRLRPEDVRVPRGVRRRARHRGCSGGR